MQGVAFMHSWCNFTYVNTWLRFSPSTVPVGMGNQCVSLWGVSNEFHWSPVWVFLSFTVNCPLWWKGLFVQTQRSIWIREKLTGICFPFCLGLRHWHLFRFCLDSPVHDLILFFFFSMMHKHFDLIILISNNNNDDNNALYPSKWYYLLDAKMQNVRKGVT